MSRTARRPRANRKPAAQAPASSPFPPIADYAFLSDCHTGALVAPDGTVEWMCVPRFDSPSLFGSLLDRGAGAFRVGPYGTVVPGARRYEPGTNVLETTWMTQSGWIVVRDALVIGPWSEESERDTTRTRPPTDASAQRVLVRTIACVQGSVQVELVCEPMFDYAREPALWEPVDGGYDAVDASHETATIRLRSDLRIGIEGNRARARHTLQEGETRFCSLSWAPGLDGPQTVEEAVRMIDETAHYWRDWLDDGHFPDHRWRRQLQRSALVLKGLTYAPTGAMVAALTTSLPERPGGERNWDYRYTWMRDATFTLWGLHAIGLDWEADDFIQFVADVPSNDDGTLQIMYAVDGRKDLTEQMLDHLTGYESARPVRIGNGAFTQRQNDVYGAVLDSVYLHTKVGGHLPQRLWPVLEAQVRGALEAWRQPDQGIWEARGEPKHYVSSKLMCWVALDRGARLAEIHGEAELGAQWQATADEIKRDILRHGVSEQGVFRQHYETDALDASTLLVPLVRFLAPDDERVVGTVHAIDRDLTDHGFVLRYRTEETDDGLSGREGTFLICSFWLVAALEEIGDHDRACTLLERLLQHASPLGLYAEELDPRSGRHLGNFPQAFTHLALINAVMHVIERTER